MNLIDSFSLLSAYQKSLLLLPVHRRNRLHLLIPLLPPRIGRILGSKGLKKTTLVRVKAKAVPILKCGSIMLKSLYILLYQHFQQPLCYRFCKTFRQVFFVPNSLEPGNRRDRISAVSLSLNVQWTSFFQRIPAFNPFRRGCAPELDLGAQASCVGKGRVECLYTPFLPFFR
jgi:hypothetical protein